MWNTVCVDQFEGCVQFDGQQSAQLLHQCRVISRKNGNVVPRLITDSCTVDGKFNVQTGSLAKFRVQFSADINGGNERIFYVEGSEIKSTPKHSKEIKSFGRICKVEI